MSMNDDFSFVRFLKVIKTLYEASTFTQLGRTVGSALKVNRDDAIMDDDEEEETLANRTRSTFEDGEDGCKQAGDTVKNSFLDALSGCASPDQYGGKSSKKKKQVSDSTTVDTRESRQTTVARSRPNFLEQVMNCTLGTDGGAESDEDTYNPRDEEQSYGAETATTFETYTDDGYESAPRSRNRGRAHR